MTFAQWLQSKMEQHGFSNYRIAKMAGVHQSTVSNWLSGSKPQVDKERLVRRAIGDYESDLDVSSAMTREPFSITTFANGISVYRGDAETIEERVLTAHGDFRIAYRSSGIVITVEKGGAATDDDVRSIVSLYSGTKKDPAVSGEVSLDSLIPNYSGLTEENKAKALDYIALLLSSQQKQ